MKTFQKSFTFRRTADACELLVTWGWGYKVEGNYPLTYTLEECLEELCMRNGYEFKCTNGDYKYEVRVAGSFQHYGWGLEVISWV